MAEGGVIDEEEYNKDVDEEACIFSY